MKVEQVLSSWDPATATPEQIAAWLRKVVGVSDYLVRNQDNRSVRAFIGKDRPVIAQALATTKSYVLGLKEWQEYLNAQTTTTETA